MNKLIISILIISVAIIFINCGYFAVVGYDDAALAEFVVEGNPENPTFRFLNHKSNKVERIAISVFGTKEKTWKDIFIYQGPFLTFAKITINEILSVSNNSDRVIKLHPGQLYNVYFATFNSSTSASFIIEVESGGKLRIVTLKGNALKNKLKQLQKEK